MGGCMEPKPQKPRKKIKLARVYCRACEKPIEYHYDGDDALYLKCWYCAEVIEAYTVNLGKDAAWMEKAEYEAEQKRKAEENKDKNKDGKEKENNV